MSESSAACRRSGRSSARACWGRRSARRARLPSRRDGDGAGRAGLGRTPRPDSSAALAHRHVRTPLRQAYARPSSRMPTKISIEHEARDEEVAEDDRPEVDEDHLDVERDEEQGVDVEREPEAPVGVAVRVDAALVGQALVGVALVAVGDQPRRPDRQEDERDARRTRTRRCTRCLRSSHVHSEQVAATTVRSCALRRRGRSPKAQYVRTGGCHARFILAGEVRRARAGAAPEIRFGSPPDVAPRAPARARRPSALVTARRTWAGDGSRRARVPVRDPSPGG